MHSSPSYEFHTRENKPISSCSQCNKDKQRKEKRKEKKKNEREMANSQGTH